MQAARVGWFSLLDASQQQLLNETALRRKVKAGTTVVRRGDRADELFVVLTGKLKVVNTTRAGRDNTFDILETDNVFGEVGLFSNGLRTADVIALEDCELSVLRRPELLFAIRRDPTIATVLLEVMAGRISAITTDLEERLAQNASTRFALCLLKLAERFGVEPVPNNVQVPIKMSQQDLADLVGVSRVFANGKLKASEHEGILSHRSGQLTVHDVRALRRIADLDEEHRTTSQRHRPRA